MPSWHEIITLHGPAACLMALFLYTVYIMLCGISLVIFFGLLSLMQERIWKNSKMVLGPDQHRWQMRQDELEAQKPENIARRKKEREQWQKDHPESVEFLKKLFEKQGKE